MLAILTYYGLLAFFPLSFCAATLLPLGAEWLLVTLSREGADPLLDFASCKTCRSLH